MTNRKKLHRISSGFISDDEIFSKPSRKVITLDFLL